MERRSVRQRTAAVMLILGSAMVFALPAGAATNSDTGDMGGGPASPPGTALTEPQQTRDRTEIVELYFAALGESPISSKPRSSAQAKSDAEGGIDAWSNYNEAVTRYNRAYEADLALSTDLSQSGELEPPASGLALQSAKASSKTLGVTWVQQQQSYYCGPATAYMILKYRGFTKSKPTGVSLSQYNLAGASYLKTNSQSYTTTWPYYDSGFTLNDMSRGLNKWAYGTLSGGFGIDQISSPSELKNIVGYSIDASRPFAVSTYEKPGEAHYNNHPPSREIGHWATVYGYSSSGGTTKVADPASGISGYASSAQKFSIATSSLYSYAAGRYSVW